MSGNYLLDTSVLVELFAKDSNILAKLKEAESTFIPSIALGNYTMGRENLPEPKRISNNWNNWHHRL